MNLVVAVRRERRSARQLDIAQIAVRKHCERIKTRLQL
jgi:hypothetical protein